MSNILLIEPNRVLAKTYHEVLVNAGHQVRTCGTAQSAIIAADDTDPQIVILELQLVAHSGAEFLYEFRSYPDWQQVPVIIHTQVAPQQFAASFEATQRQLGIVEYLYKPATNLSRLLTAVQNAASVRI